MENIELDPQIRDWVVLPIIAVLLIVNLLKTAISGILTTQNEEKDLEKISQNHILIRARNLRMNNRVLPGPSFSMRKHYFNSENGLLNSIKPNENPMMQPQMDPSKMMGMMKKNMLVGTIPQIALMAWINHFFSGFVCVKLPFALTLQFRGMLQRGIELQTLDMSYVSSVSFYVIALFGLQGVTSLILGATQDKTASNPFLMEQQLAQQMAAGGGGQPGVPDDTGKKFLQEKNEIELISHSFMGDNVEKRILNQMK